MRIRIASLFAIPSLVFTACTEWAVQPLPEGPRPAAVAATRVRVTRVDGRVMELTGVAVHGDSLYGTRVYYVEDPQIVLPLSEVARVEAERANATVPALVALGTTAVLMRWVLLPWIFAGS
jgi:hypothetical protein